MADDDTSVSGPGNNAGTDTGAGFDPGASTGSADTSSIDPGSNTPVSDTPSTGPGGVASPPDGESLGGTWSQEGAPWVSTFPNGTQIVVNPDGSHTFRVAINGPGSEPETAPEDTSPSENPGASFIPWDGPLTQGGQEDDFNWLLDRPPLSLDMSRAYKERYTARLNLWVWDEMAAAGLGPDPAPADQAPTATTPASPLAQGSSSASATGQQDQTQGNQSATGSAGSGGAAQAQPDGSAQPKATATQEAEPNKPQNGGDENPPANQEKARNPEQKPNPRVASPSIDDRLRAQGIDRTPSATTTRATPGPRSSWPPRISSMSAASPQGPCSTEPLMVKHSMPLLVLILKLYMTPEKQMD